MTKFLLTVVGLLAGLGIGLILIALAYYGLELRGFYMLIVCAATATLAVLPAILLSSEGL